MDCLSLVSVACCQAGVSAMGRSPIWKSPADCVCACACAFPIFSHPNGTW
jgi:hypothetical protein